MRSAGRSSGMPGGLVVGRHPAGADAELEATAGEHVERGRLLGDARRGGGSRWRAPSCRRGASLVASAAAIRPGIGARPSSKWSAMVSVDQPRSSTLRARARQPAVSAGPRHWIPNRNGCMEGSLPGGRGLRCPPMGDLSGYEKDTFTFDGKTRDVYRKGDGPGRARVRGDARHHAEGARLRRPRRRASAAPRSCPTCSASPAPSRSVGKTIRAIAPGVRVEGVLGVGHRQDQPGRRVVQGAGPPRARAARRPGRRRGRHVLHRQLRPRPCSRSRR